MAYDLLNYKIVEEKFTEGTKLISHLNFSHNYYKLDDDLKVFEFHHFTLFLPLEEYEKVVELFVQELMAKNKISLAI